MGFWYNNPHTAYASNDTICNIIKAIKCLHKVNVEQTNALNAEVQARKLADEALQKAIDDETTARKLADGSLQTSIEDETLARTNADNELQDALDKEEEARKDGDAILTEALNDETIERKESDYSIGYDTLNKDLTIIKGVN